MPSKKTLQRKRAKARKAKARKQIVKGWKNLPRLPTALCAIIRDYVAEFKAFPARLDTVCEKWYNFNLQFKAILGLLQMIGLPDPDNFSEAEREELQLLVERMTLTREETKEKHETTAKMFNIIWTTEQTTEDDRTLARLVDTCLEDLLESFDPVEPRFRIVAARAINPEFNKHKYEWFTIQNGGTKVEKLA